MDDVTFTSLPQTEEIALGGEGMFEAKFYGLGADGTVGANKKSVKFIGDNTDKYCQAYFSYEDVYKRQGLCYAFVLPIGILIAKFPSTVLRFYTDNPDLIASSIPSLWVMLSSCLLYTSTRSGTPSRNRPPRGYPRLPRRAVS